MACNILRIPSIKKGPNSEKTTKIVKGKQVIIQEELEIAQDDMLSIKQLLDNMMLK